MMMHFSGKRIWIIGASTGIGAALAVELSKRGARLILSARTESALQSLRTKLSGIGHEILVLDVADDHKVKDAVLHVQETFKTIDSVIFMAALYEPMKTPHWDLSKLKDILKVNLESAFYVAHAVLPVLEKQGKGQFALCGSVAGYVGLPDGQPYSATKAAIMNLAESLRAYYARTEVDIRLISPGFVRTPLTDKNKFAMPMMIEPEAAARAIADGLEGENFEIHFPKKFTYLMKILRLLPHWIYFPLAGKMKG